MDIPGFPFNSILDIGSKIIDRVIPDPQQKADAQLKLLALNQSNDLQLLQTQMSAIVAEAQSPDPWTSRARPSFLYVMYALLLWSIPMGLISAFSPSTAQAITAGMTGYLAAIPKELYGLMGVGYLGYTAARQYGKAVGSDK